MKSQTIVMVDQDELLTKVELIIEKSLEKYVSQKNPIYVSPKRAMEILNIKVSKLQQLRNEYDIQYSKPSSRGIMYRYDSLIEYLDRNIVT